MLSAMSTFDILKLKYQHEGSAGVFVKCRFHMKHSALFKVLLM